MSSFDFEKKEKEKEKNNKKEYLNMASMESGFYAIRLHRSNRFVEVDLRDGSLYAKKLESGDSAQCCVWYVEFHSGSLVSFLSARGRYISTKLGFFTFMLSEGQRTKEQGPGDMEKFMLVGVLQDKTQCYFFKSKLGKYVSVKMPEVKIVANASSPTADSVFEFVRVESEESPIVF